MLVLDRDGLTLQSYKCKLAYSVMFWSQSVVIEYFHKENAEISSAVFALCLFLAAYYRLYQTNIDENITHLMMKNQVWWEFFYLVMERSPKLIPSRAKSNITAFELWFVILHLRRQRREILNSALSIHVCTFNFQAAIWIPIKIF